MNSNRISIDLSKLKGRKVRIYSRIFEVGRIEQRSKNVQIVRLLEGKKEIFSIHPKRVYDPLKNFEIQPEDEN